MNYFTFGHRKKQFTLLLLILTISAVATDLYTPSFSAIAKGLSTTVNGVQWTISLFVFMLGISQVFYGPLSDFIGRKKVLILGFAIATLGSCLCVFSHSVEDLFIGRMLQGFGLGAPAVLWRSIFRDKYEGDSLAREVSYFAPIAISTILAAPFFGGIIQEQLGWRANFAYLLCHIIFVSLIVFFFFKETKRKELNKEDQEKSKFKSLLASYKELFASKTFMAYSFCCFFAYGAFFSWTVSAPIIFLDHMAVDPYELGKLMLLAGLPMGLGGFLNGKIVISYGAENIIRFSLILLLFVSLFILLTPFFLEASVFLLILPMVFFTFLSGFLWPNLFSLAFKSVGHISGTAASVYGLFQMMGGAIFSAVLSIAQEESQVSLGAVMVFCLVSSLLVSELVMKKTEKLTTVEDQSPSPKVELDLEEGQDEFSPKSFV